LEGIVTSVNLPRVCRAINNKGYGIISTIYHSADANILALTRNIRIRICIPKNPFRPLLGRDLINLLLGIINLIHALCQYAETKNHDNDGRHQDNKKDQAGFVINFFKLKKHSNLF